MHPRALARSALLLWGVLGPVAVLAGGTTDAHRAPLALALRARRA